MPASTTLPETDALPAGESSESPCDRCDYPGTPLAGFRCPECGLEVTEKRLRARALRREDVLSWRERDRLLGAQRWVVLIAIYAVGAAVVSRSVSVLFVAVVGLAAAVSVSGALGRLPARLAPLHRRDITDVTWRRSVWMLHLPWIVAPVFVVCALVSGLVDRWAGDGVATAYVSVVLVGFWLWILGLLGVLVGWWIRYSRRSVSYGSPLGRAEAAGFALGVGVLAGSSLLGLAAGIVTAVGVGVWLGLALD